MLKVFVVTAGNREFAGLKSLRAHVKNVHGAERTIFTCPVIDCHSKFLSIWATGKHLARSEWILVFTLMKTMLHSIYVRILCLRIIYTLRVANIWISQ